MKKIIAYMAIMACLALSASCQKEVDKTITWPQWASRPIIENLGLTSTDGKKSITAGEQVRLQADLSDEFNNLKSWTVSVRYGSALVVSLEGSVSGDSGKIDETFVLPFAADVPEGGFYPEVTVVVYNVANGMSSKRVENDRNVTVNRPATPEKLYVVDNLGNIYEMVKDAGDYAFRTTEGIDLTSLGDSFHIAEKVSSNAPDFSGLVWGMKDGTLSIVSDNSPIETPDTGEYGFKQLGFNVYSFKFNNLVNYSVTVKKAEMEEDEQNGVGFLAMNSVQLIHDCEVVFDGFGDLKSMLQPDRFEVITPTTAKFTGHSVLWNLYYFPEDNWFIANYRSFNAPDQVWVTGEFACFPLGNDNTAHEFLYLAGDGKVRYASLSAIKEAKDTFHILVYCKEGFYIELYRWVKWSTRIALNSLTPEYAEIMTNGMIIKQGSDFKPGVYYIWIHLTEPGDEFGDGAFADVSMTPYTL